MAVRNLWICLFASVVIAQEQPRWQFDFLAGYYDQSGDHSAVTGGEGTEDLTSVSPVIDIVFNPESNWSYTAHIGVDNVSSASIDAMDNVSGASKVDTRAFGTFGAQLDRGNQRYGGFIGFSKEYDYTSINGGVSGSFDFNQKNSTLGISLATYADTVDLYDIDGVHYGQDDRSTTDLTLSFSQVLGKKTVLSAEVFISDQSGFLSSPFQEVILTDGIHVAERLPDSRSRNALSLRLNHAFTDRFVLRTFYRYYDDDFDIGAHTFELEPFFKLGSRGSWISFSARAHQQDGSPYFVLPATATESDAYFTSDRDLSTFDSTRFSLGYHGKTDLRWMDRFQIRATAYERDEGLSSFTLSFGFGWSQ
ncbi:MAG: DUF3570 domain-containing protein [Acidobacteria bacterium]|nr:DUF3570 domain-containing protein [Acidobacteriota bacterium]